MQNQPGYGPAPYGAPPPPAPAGGTGLQPNIAAPLSYVFVPITSIIFLMMEKNSKLVRFHAIQAMLFAGAIIVLSIALMIVGLIVTTVLSFISTTLAGIVGLLLTLVWVAFSLAIFAGWVISVIKAYQGVMFKLPVIGNYAESMSNK